MTGCKKCPIVKMCPGESVIGDRKSEQADRESE